MTQPTHGLDPNALEATRERAQAALDSARATGPNSTSQTALEYRLAECIDVIAALSQNPGTSNTSGEALRAHLREHWLASIVCDHEAKTDTAICSCSQWADTPHPSVGAAVDAWIEHVFATLPAALASSERSGREAAVCSVKTMKLSDGREDHYVSIMVGDREITPYRFTIKGRAEFEVAELNWLLNGAEKPDILDWLDRTCDPNDPTETAIRNLAGTKDK